MPWVRLDDEFPEHPKLISVGPLGMALQVAALCYSNAHLTDGFIQFNVVNKLLSWEFSPPESDVIYTICLTSGMSGDDVDSKMIADWLVKAGIWEQVQGGYKIHDYTDYQMTKEEIYALHETRTAVGKLGGRPKKNQINQTETNLVSKTKPNGNQTINQMPNQNESKTKPQSQTQSPSIPNEVKKDKGNRAQAPEAIFPASLDCELFKTAWSEWVIFRAEIKHKITLSTQKAQFRQLEKHNATIAAAMLRQSIEKGWTGIFELKSNGNGTHTFAENYE